ncbi:MAG TPA: MFS transporter [Fimbriimonas sp.]
MSKPEPNLKPTLLQRMGVDFRLSPILGIFLTVFLDMLAFGMFIPDIQLRGELLSKQALGANPDPAQVGLLIGFTQGVFSLVQLVTSPFLGRISDRYGRRRVLLISTALSVVSYLIYAHADSLEMMIFSRILSGIAAANIGVAFAYVADITTPQDRAKGLGLMGAAFGLGFILGPVTGGLLLELGNDRPLLLGYVAAALALLNFLYVLFVLPESREHANVDQPPLARRFSQAFSTPGLGLLLLLFFAANFAFTNLETTFFRLLADPRTVFDLGADAKQSGSYILGIVGVVSAIMQGYVVRKTTPKYGEVRLLRFSYLLMAPALALVPFAPLWIPMLIVIVFLGIGTGLAQPSLSSLISRTAPKDMQGGIFGVTQGLGALGRFVAPLVSNSLFQAKPYYPYLLGAVLILFPAFASWKLRMPNDAPEDVAAA